MAIRRAGTRSRRRPSLITIAATWLALITLLALLCPILPIADPNATGLLNVNAAPSVAHPLGTDSLGRDVLSRVIWGSRTSLLGPAMVTILATAIGTAIALVAAWRAKATDAVVGLTVDVSLAFPALLLAILAVAVVGPGMLAPVIAISIAYIPYVVRLVRGVAIRERSKPYVAALSSLGFGGIRISIRHLVPNLKGYVSALFALAFGYAMVDLAALSFLGLGVQPPTSDWGNMVGEGQSDLIAGHPQVSLSAGLLIVITVVCVNILGERLAEDSPGAA